MTKTINTYQNGKIGRLFRQANGDYPYALELGGVAQPGLFSGQNIRAIISIPKRRRL
jgi:hypothetical protein